MSINKLILLNYTLSKQGCLMPPRIVTLIVIGFFIAVNASLFYSEILPRMQAGQPPAFSVDLADEAGNIHPAVNWKVIVRGEEFLKLSTGVFLVDGQEDEFLLWAEFLPAKEPNKQTESFGLNKMKSEFRIHRDGDLLGLTARLEIKSFRNLEFPLTLTIMGEISKGMFFPVVSTESKLGERIFNLEPMPVPISGAIFQPFQPVHRVLGLYPGRTWKQPFFDPLSMALSSGISQGSMDQGIGTIVAQVRNETAYMTWLGKNVPCYIVDYIGHDLESTVWVGIQNGTVLRQKIKLAESMEWDLIRIN